jgi:predicted DNA-binding transcriptional regulator YafY
MNTYIQRLRALELFLINGRRSKSDCVQQVGHGCKRTFQRDLAALQDLGAKVVRVETPGKESVYYLPRARAVFRHT